MEQYHPAPPGDAAQQPPPPLPPVNGAVQQLPPFSSPLSNATQQLPPFPQPPINATQQPPPFSQPPGTPMPGISSPAPAQYSYPLPQPAQQLGHLHPQAQQYQYPAPTMTPNPHLQYHYPPPAATPNPQHQYQYPQSMLLSTTLGQRPESQHGHQPPQHPPYKPTPLMPPQTSQTPNYIYTQGYPPGSPAPPQANQYQHQTPPQQPASLGTLALGKVTSALQKLSLGGAHPGVNQGSTQPGSTLTPTSVSAPPVSLSSIPIPKPTPQPAAQQTFDRDASWRVTDPATSLPTREFTAVANFMFDKLDAGREPKNTRLMEFSKMLPIVKHYVTLPPFGLEDQHFQTKNYGEVLASQFGWWGVEHLLVPVCGTRLDEHFEAVAGGYHLTVNPGDVAPGSLASNKQLKASLLASYSPVLTRRGFHQWLYIIVNCPTMKLDLKRCVIGTVGGEWLRNHSNSLPNLDKYDAKPHSGTAEMIRKINDGLIEPLVDRFRFTEDWAGTSIYPRGAPKQPPPAAQSTAQAPTAAQGPSQAIPGVAMASSTASAAQPAAASAAVEDAAIDQLQTAAANVNAEAQALTELRLAQHAVRANMLALDCLDASIGYSPYYRPY